jgi:hypothetical protein
VTLNLLRGSLSLQPVGADNRADALLSLAYRLIRDARRTSRARIVPLSMQLPASHLAHLEQNYWIIDLGRIESLVLTLNDADDCQKTFALLGRAT